MAKPLIVIITRMHASKGDPSVADGDEFVSVWLQNEKDEHVSFKSDICDFLLLHGYNEKYAAADEGEEAQVVVKQVQEANKLCGIELDRYQDDDLYFLYHGPRVGFMLSEKDVAPAFEGRKVRVARFSTAPEDLGKIKIYGPGAESTLKELGLPEEVINFVKRARSIEPGSEAEPKPSMTVSARREAFSHLKHQVTQLFLPLSIDLQGIQQADAGENQLQYAADIIKDRSGQKSLTQRLSELRFLVAKLDDRPEKTSLRNSDFFSIWEYLDPALQNSDAGRNLLALSGMVFIDDKPAVDAVSKYFADVDGVIDPARLLPAMITSFQIPLWNNGQSKIESMSFDAWLKKLDSVLDELRTAAVERAQRGGSQKRS